jgi:hypothetical protein
MRKYHDTATANKLKFSKVFFSLSRKKAAQELLAFKDPVFFSIISSYGYQEQTSDANCRTTLSRKLIK